MTEADSKSHIGNPWSFAVAYIEMQYHDQVLANGSGFFWKVSEQTFLVSNWHNFSGRDPETAAAISSNGGLPSHISFNAFKRLSEADPAGYFEMSIERVRVPLYDSDLSGPRWLVHPRLGRRVDVAAIDVSEAVQGLVINYVNEIEVPCGSAERTFRPGGAACPL